MMEAATTTQSVTRLQQDVEQFLHWLQSQGYHFHTISPASHAAYLKRVQKSQANNLTDAFGWSLPFQANLLPPAIFESLVTHQLLSQKSNQHSHSEAQNNLWQSHIRVSSLNDGLFIHSAYPTTQDNAVFFGPDTYRFIYALQQHLAIKQPTIQHAIEICSGGAPAAITLARYAPQADVIAVDINELALQYAAINAQHNQANNVRTVCSNLYQQVQGQFDFITANPPYLVDAEQRLYRHGGELMGAELSLKIVKASLDRLAVHGTLLLYTGVVIAQGQDLLHQALKSYLAPRHQLFSMDYQEIDPDIFADELDAPGYPDAERIAAVVAVITRLV